MKLGKGMKYSGKQLTKSGSFKLEMHIDFIDSDNETMGGVFKIHNLSKENKTLTTYFEACIMGKKHKFENEEVDNIDRANFNLIYSDTTYNVIDSLPTNSSNNAINPFIDPSEPISRVIPYIEYVENTSQRYEYVKETDKSHWCMFPEWEQEVFENDDYDYKTSQYIYFKIKELFVLPEINKDKLAGASIEGYYYCCYHKKLDCFSGHYYYNNPIHNTVLQQIMLEKKQERVSSEGCII